MSKASKTIAIITFVFISFYLFGYLFPELWWSTHFIKFLSPFQIVGLILLLCVTIYFNSGISKKLYKFELNSITITSISIGYMLLVICFPMVIDYYGDAYKMIPFLEKTPQQIPEQAHDYFFDFSLNPWAGQNTIYAIVTYIAYYLQVTYKTAYYILNTIFSGLFVFTWLFFITRQLNKNHTWQFILTLTGLTAPFMLNFFGHFEVYAAILFFTLLWFVLAFQYTETLQKKYLIWLLLILLVCIKLHAISLLLFPSYFILLLRHFKGIFLRPVTIIKYIIAPIFLIGILLYFFYFKDHNDNRALNTVAMEFDHIFLPLISPDAPLDKYNMFSINHIFDYFSELLFWSPLALALLISFLFLYKSHINFNHPKLIISGLALLLYTCLFFAINPLLGMPMDWDLFAIPAPILLIFLLSICTQLKTKTIPKSFVLLTIILTILSLPVFIIHTSEDALSKRLESLAERTYHSYYEWTDTINERAINMGDQTYNYLERMPLFIKKLEPYAQKGIDFEYGKLLRRQGRFYLRETREYEKAIIYFQQSNEYYFSQNNHLLTLEAYFQMEAYDKAYATSKILIHNEYPSLQNAYKISIHCGLEAKLYNEVLLMCNIYLQQWPEDQTVVEVQKRLLNNDRVDELKKLFRSTAN